MNKHSRIRFIFPSSVILSNLLIAGTTFLMPGNYLSQLPFYLHPAFVLTLLSITAIVGWSAYHRYKSNKSGPVYPISETKKKFQIQEPDWLFLSI